MVVSIIQLEAIIVLYVLIFLGRSGASSIRLTLTFNEHCIFLDSKHRPMAISRQSFERLLAIVEQFPGYFAGSNADLPIVGGSILTHDHYQGGRHVFPMEVAPIQKSFTFAGFKTVKAGDCSVAYVCDSTNFRF